MYLTIESMNLLDGIIDLYLTDFKYGNDECAKRLSGVDRYMEVVSRNHEIASRQCDVIVRHLVLPNHIECCTRNILGWIAENISSAVVNVMEQYRPHHRAHEFDDISRPLSGKEYAKALKIADELGLSLTR
jgi:putative pyruvate formate lyase activating enzyme